jgi:hypothetical protein
MKKSPHVNLLEDFDVLRPASKLLNSANLMQIESPSPSNDVESFWGLFVILKSWRLRSKFGVANRGQFRPPIILGDDRLLNLFGQYREKLGNFDEGGHCDWVDASE